MASTACTTSSRTRPPLHPRKLPSRRRSRQSFPLRCWHAWWCSSSAASLASCCRACISATRSRRGTVSPRAGSCSRYVLSTPLSVLYVMLFCAMLCCAVTNSQPAKQTDRQTHHSPAACRSLTPSETVHTGAVVHRPASACSPQGRATRSTAAVLHAPASLVRHRRRAPRHRRLGHLSHHRLRGRLQGPRGRVMCELGRLHRRDVSRPSPSLFLARSREIQPAGSSLCT